MVGIKENELADKGLNVWKGEGARTVATGENNYALGTLLWKVLMMGQSTEVK